MGHWALCREYSFSYLHNEKPGVRKAQGRSETILYSNIYLLIRHLPIRSLQWVLLCLICAPKGHGQSVTNSYGKIVVEITKEKRTKKISTKVDITTAFPGGDSAWIKTLENELNRSIPFRNGAKKGKHIASVAFAITKDGSISDIRCLSDPGFGMCEEVVRALKKGPRWTPAPAGGIKVHVIDANNQ